MMELPSPGDRAAVAGGRQSPVDYFNSADLQGVLEIASKHYAQIIQQHEMTDEFFYSSGGEKIKIDGSSVLQIQLHREEGCGKMLILVNPRRRESGSLYNDRSSHCYLLPVLDTLFVRKRWRRHGLGTRMLQDYCQTFARELALGVSCPISPAMYRVCSKFLRDHPEEQDRMWEVDPPGDWSQRINIWLKIQLGETPALQECISDYTSECTDTHSLSNGKIVNGRLDRKGSISPEDDSYVVLRTRLENKKRRRTTDCREEIVNKQRKIN
ncbi:Hypothetical predicted protein [Pelobates cultripes]|uniref:Protein FAM169B n=1 Tax=Pelobates cultripes TaxID=61616 RepID=A0AAD1VUZ1_PELCU|nr:Hypothetical predicted protein [Pelobates cultripes]